MSTKCAKPAPNPKAKGQNCLCNEIGVPGKGCQVCGKGMIPNDDHSECVSCGNGFPNSDGETCTMCRDNEYLKGEKCSTCGKNTYLKSDSSGCDTCPTGTYANEGATECTVCGNVCPYDESTCPACGATTSTEETKLSGGVIAGIVIGSLALVGVIGVGVVMFYRKSRKSRNKILSSDIETMNAAFDLDNMLGVEKKVMEGSAVREEIDMITNPLWESAKRKLEYRLANKATNVRDWSKQYRSPEYEGM